MKWRAKLRWDEAMRLGQVEAGSTPGFDGQEAEAEVELGPLLDELAELQTRLWASKAKGLLVVLQGHDTAGKDGATNKVLGRMTTLGFRVHAFGVPTDEEAAHDFLWRAHACVPARGELAVFNRSHYEDVLIRRVQKIDPEKRWRPRYRHIREWERLLVEDGDVVMVKVLLHISKSEQAKRLQARLDDPTKRWKFRTHDLADRAKWKQYDDAYDDALRETDADHAPWYLVPADHKWYRDLALAHLLHETLTALKLRYPEPSEDLSKVVIK